MGRRLPNVDGQTTPGRFDDFFYVLLEERRLLKKPRKEYLKKKSVFLFSSQFFCTTLNNTSFAKVCCQNSYQKAQATRKPQALKRINTESQLSPKNLMTQSNSK